MTNAELELERSAVSRQWATVTAGLLLSSMILLIVDPEWSVRAVSGVGLAVALMSLIAVGSSIEGGFWSIPQTCLLTLCIFHAGALVEFLHSDTPAFLGGQRLLRMPEMPTAVYLSSVGISAFATFAILGYPKDRKESSSPSDVQVRQSVSVVGGVTLVLGCALWFGFARRAGLGVGSNYSDYLESVSGTPVPLFYQLINLALPLAMVRYRTRLNLLVWLVYCLFAVVAFPLGLRGEVLFPAVVAAAVIGLQRPMPSWRQSTAVVLLLLVPIAVVAQTRLTAEQRSTTSISVDPLRGVYEMGGTLYVVAETVRWHQTEEEPFYHGRTYVAPLRDSGKRFVLRDKNYDPSRDMDYMATQVITRVGYFGGSVIAEAYDNFGRTGVIAVMALFGAALGRLSGRAKGSAGALFGAIAAAVMFQQLVRNAFESAPVLALLSLILWLLSLGVAAVQRTLKAT
ncbi:O-antigen polysaccharide polymerase Wzy [Nocardioides sp.]|uniref:O-antigen polysaccharide polymerase Wzy n=1 Tax=Nocardioides sp. TaxID=35761 RepID=UPI00378444AF